LSLFLQTHTLLPLILTDERESPQEAQPAWEHRSLGFIEAVHQW